MGLASVRVDIAPVYERPDAKSLRLDEAMYGASVQVLQENGAGWCYLRTEYRTEGYTPTACLVTDSAVAASWRKYKKAVVLAPYIDVQESAEPGAARLCSLARGGVLVPLGQPAAGGWQKVGLADGAVGYTRASYLGEAITDWEAMGEADMRWNIVETALSYSGAAWRAGGRTLFGMDAVGLAAMSYAMNGVLIPRRCEFAQGSVLHPVNPKSMGEGDLLYFSGSIGVYTGSDKFVHATDISGGEGVVVSSLRARDSDYRGDLAGSIVAVAGLF